MTPASLIISGIKNKQFSLRLTRHCCKMW